MSCPDEATLCIYVDGELETPARRALDTHLIGCQACRIQVLALREEAQLLGDVLHDRRPVEARLPSRRAPARGLALGAGPALAAAALVAAVVGWIAEAEMLPSGFGWLNPFRLEGATPMLFDFVFALRNEAPALLSLAVGVSATLSISALLTFALGVALRRFRGPGALLLAGAALLAAPQPGHAHFGLHEHEDFELPAGEVHHGTVVTWAERVIVDGVVDGDLIVGTERLVVRGEVRGNVLAFAKQVQIEGGVQGSLWCVCSRTRVDGRLDADLYVATNELAVGPTAEIGRNATAFVENAEIAGRIGRDLVAGVEQLELRGRVERDLVAWSEGIALRDGSEIGGDVIVVIEEDALDVAPGATIGGEVSRRPFEAFDDDDEWSRYSEPAFYVFHLLQLVGAFAVGLLLHRLFPRAFGGGLETPGAFFRTLGVGLLAVIATPLALVMLALTLAGLPLALIGLGTFFTALYLSGILVAALVGTSLVSVSPERGTGFPLALLAGLTLVMVLAHLPFLGGPVRLVVGATGMGLIVERAWAAWGPRREVA